MASYKMGQEILRESLNFDLINMAAKEEKEKAKFVRETIVKYFFDMSKSTFTVMVLGGMAALFGIVQTNQEDSYWAIFWGVFLTVILFIIGLLISKR